jgi:hypothetical protein
MKQRNVTWIVVAGIPAVVAAVVAFAGIRHAHNSDNHGREPHQQKYPSAQQIEKKINKDHSRRSV